MEEPDIFDCNNGLVGEGLEEGNLFFGERPQLGAPDRDGPNRNALAQKRNRQYRPNTQALMGTPIVRIVFVEHV